MSEGYFLSEVFFFVCFGAFVFKLICEVSIEASPTFVVFKESMQEIKAVVKAVLRY